MMIKNTSITLFIFFSVILLSSSNTGVATNQKRDRTGSPVSTGNCGTCHSGGSFGSPTISLKLKDDKGNVVTQYDPGKTYTFEVEMTANNASAYGYQSVVLMSGNTQAGTITALSNNTKVVTLNNRSYMEQKSLSASGLFQSSWKAPAQGSGDVKFYANGLAVNSDSDDTGDLFIKGNAITINENLDFLSDENQKEIMVTAYPNPSRDFVSIQSNLPLKQAKLFTVEGKEVLLVNENFDKIDIRAINNGVYFFVINTHDGNQVISKILIQ